MSRTTEFNRDEVIQKAMNLFWEKGYNGTSLKDLTEATGLLKGSLYNTFKSKENLFLMCLESYGNYSRSFFYTSGDPKEYLKKFFERLINDGVQPENRKGCLIMNSCLELSQSNGAPKEKTKVLFSAVEMNIENVVKKIISCPLRKREKICTNLVAAAFSIREISKFKKDKAFLTQIANNALKDLEIKI